jgi:hypothetical protein
MYKKSKDKIRSKQLKQKELKRQEQNKEKYFANLKGQEELKVLQPPQDWKIAKCQKKSCGARK